MYMVVLTVVGCWEI